ncbi:MAG: MmgE/PrpD family protein [Minwuiales bacterium]|nr:MmgE/PrpD family protein [Minwuiales bacterium]
MDAIERFADHVVGCDVDDLPPAAVRAAKTFILDSIGVGVVGSAGPWVEELVASLSGWGAGDDARLLVRGTRLPAPAAAMGNAYQTHNSEFDCVHEGAVVHPMACVLSSVLAEADRAGGVTGPQFMAAVALGVDVACGIGVASNAPLRFFRPGTAGGFGAAAAVGRLRSFDRETLLDALGLAYSQMCGTMQAHVEGSTVLAMQIGFNARNAVVACDMAARGLRAPRELLEGQFGYYALFEGDRDLAPVLSGLGRDWCIAELAHKPFPSGRATHGIVDGVLDVQRTHGFAAAEVAGVTARVPPLTHRLVGRPVKPDMTVNYARLCGAYVTARALIAGGVGVDDFLSDALADPATLALAGRVEIVADDNPDDNALLPIAIEIHLENGRRHDITLDVVYGNPAKPMTRDAHLAKFRRNWASGAVPLDADRGEQMIAMIDDLESVADIRSLIDLAVA